MSVVRYVEKPSNVLVWRFTEETAKAGVSPEFNNGSVVIVKDLDGNTYCWVHTYEGTVVCVYGDYIAYHERKGFMVLDAESMTETIERADTPLDRMYIERRDLSDKIKKLDMFLRSPACEKLDMKMVDLLQRQLPYMKKYAATLNERIKLME